MLMLALSKPLLVNKIKARIHGAILRTPFLLDVYTVSTFRATLHEKFDERLPSSHVIMFTSPNLK